MLADHPRTSRAASLEGSKIPLYCKVEAAMHLRLWRSPMVGSFIGCEVCWCRPLRKVANHNYLHYALAYQYTLGKRNHGSNSAVLQVAPVTWSCLLGEPWRTPQKLYWMRQAAVMHWTWFTLLSCLTDTARFAATWTTTISIRMSPCICYAVSHQIVDLDHYIQNVLPCPWKLTCQTTDSLEQSQEFGSCDFYFVKRVEPGPIKCTQPQMHIMRRIRKGHPCRSTRPQSSVRMNASVRRSMFRKSQSYSSQWNSHKSYTSLCLLTESFRMRPECSWWPIENTNDPPQKKICRTTWPFS